MISRWAQETFFGWSWYQFCPCSLVAAYVRTSPYRPRAKREAVIGYQSTVLNALEEVENALVSYSQEQERRDRLTMPVAHSQLAVDLGDRAIQSRSR